MVVNAKFGEKSEDKMQKNLAIVIVWAVTVTIGLYLLYRALYDYLLIQYFILR